MSNGQVWLLGVTGRLSYICRRIFRAYKAYDMSLTLLTVMLLFDEPSMIEQCIN